MVSESPEINLINGFSIEKLAKSYRAKLNNSSLRQNNALQRSSDDNELLELEVCLDPEIKSTRNNLLDQEYHHWANRDFREYCNAA